MSKTWRPREKSQMECTDLTSDEAGRSRRMPSLTRRLLINTLPLLLLLAAGCLVRQAQADAALSEVWTESDGLQIKYSTNHDDVLSSRGSEMSQSNNQPKQHNEEQQTAVAPSESAEAGGESNAGQSSSSGGSQESSESPASGGEESTSSENGANGASGQQEESSGGDEEGAADTRKNEKLVMPSLAGRVHSYSSDGLNTHRAAQGGRTKSQSSLRPVSSADQESNSESDSNEASPAKRGAFKSSAASSSENGNTKAIDSTSTFDFPGPSSDGSEGGSNDDEEHSSSADAGPSRALRQPGRLFKEAVRLTESGSKREEQTSTLNEDDESSGTSRPSEQSVPENQNGSGNTDKAQSRPATSESNKSNDDDDGDTNEDNNSSGSWSTSPAGSEKRPQEEQNMIESFDSGAKMSDANNQANSAHSDRFFKSATPHAGVRSAIKQYADEDADERPPTMGRFMQHQLSNGYHDNSNSRALIAASSQKGLQSQPASGRPTPAMISGGPNVEQQRQNHNQLAYFRSLNQNQMAAGLRHGSHSVANANPQQANDNSPDSVRDNFISPGHYPGSMPHLTLASEVAPSNASTTSDQHALTSNSQTKVTSQKKLNDYDGGNASKDNRLTTATSDTNSEDDEEASKGSDRTSGEKLSINAVTPVPALEPESQQIMAPTLVPTTTMAPMVSSTAEPQAAVTAPPTAAVITSSTTNAPSLKRFKLRRYR